MATIMKKTSKKGDVSYRIQIYSKNKGTGKVQTKVATWKKPDFMNEREAVREVNAYALKFEEKVRSDAKFSTSLTNKITLKEYIPIWLEYVKSNNSPSYYYSVSYISKFLDKELGGYQMGELTPLIIQRFIDRLSKVKVGNSNAKAKNLLYEIKEKEKLSLSGMARKAKVCAKTISLALNNGSVQVETAEKIANSLGINAENLFIIDKNEKYLSQSSQSRYCRVLRTILAMAKRQQIIRENYSTRDFVKLVPEPKSKVKCMAEVELKKFVNGLKKEDDIRIKTVFMILVLTGLRRGEVCGLEWKDIDFDAKDMHIQRASISVAGMGVLTGSTKTENSNRIISLPEMLCVTLKEYKLYFDNHNKLLGNNKNERLFVQTNGNAIYPTTIGYWLKKILKKYGIDNSYTVHSLRHSNITMQLVSGIPLKTVSARAGHSSTKVTSEVYSHFIKSSDRAAAEKINTLFA